MAQPATNVWRDPQLEIGPFRILPRTDGRFAVYDERLPLGSRSAAIEDTKEAAVAAAKKLVALGSPLVIASEPPPRDPTPTAARPRRSP